MDNTLLFIGLMARAHALAVGAEDAYDAAREHKARLLFRASDGGKNTVGAMRNAADEGGIPYVELPYTKAELGDALGCGTCAAAAVLDTGMARSLCEKLGLSDEAALLAERLAREKRRKAKKEAGKQKNTAAHPLSGAAGRIAARKTGKARTTDKRGK